MSDLSALALEAIGISGFLMIVIVIGFFSTMGVRTKHREEMIRLNEQSKLNAITIDERKANVSSMYMTMLQAEVKPKELTDLNQVDRADAERILREWARGES